MPILSLIMQCRIETSGYFGFSPFLSPFVIETAHYIPARFRCLSNDSWFILLFYTAGWLSISIFFVSKGRFPVGIRQVISTFPYSQVHL